MTCDLLVSWRKNQTKTHPKTLQVQVPAIFGEFNYGSWEKKEKKNRICEEKTNLILKEGENYLCIPVPFAVYGITEL